MSVHHRGLVNKPHGIKRLAAWTIGRLRLSNGYRYLTTSVKKLGSVCVCPFSVVVSVKV